MAIRSNSTGTGGGSTTVVVGPPGKDGTNGTNGTNGKEGAPGESAYQIWLDAGNTGSPADFLASLQGKPGKDGINGSSTGGIEGSSGFATRTLVGAGVTQITVPAGVTKVLLKAHSAGAGGQTKTAAYVSSATQSGAYGESILTVAPGDVLNVNVGIGGPAYGQTDTPANPNAVDTLIYRNGIVLLRVPGGYSTSQKTGCDMFIAQSVGMPNLVIAGTEYGFPGANAPLGGAGGGGAILGTGDGEDGVTPGGAGSNGGGTAGSRGGKGGDGLVEIWF